MVRIDGPIVDPRWRVDDVGLEEIVLAYLGRGASARRYRDARPAVAR